MSDQHTPEPRATNEQRAMARAVGRESAWRDLMRRFGQRQRRHVANMLAHSWTVQAIEIRSHYEGNVERIEAESSHEDAVAAIYRERGLPERVADKKVAELEAHIVRRVNAHDDLVQALTDLLHNSAPPHSGEAAMDADFERRYKAAADNALAKLAAIAKATGSPA